MEGLACDIVGLYAGQVDILDSFLSLSRKKTELIRENRTGELDALIRAEEALLMQLSRLESRRRKALEMLCNERALTGPLGMKELRELLDEDELSRLDELTDRFRDALRQQRKSNRLNKRLLDVRIRYADHVLRLLDRETPAGGSAAAGRSIIDKRA